MKMLLRLLLCVVAPLLSAEAGPARKLLEEGLLASEQGNHAEAAEAFEKASEAAPEDELDPAIAYFNLGNTLKRIPERLPESTLAYEKAARTPDLDLQGKALFNSGNAWMEMGRQSMNGGDLAKAGKETTRAVELFRKSIQLDPADRDRKVNYELALRLEEELKKLQQQQQNQQQNQQQQDQQDQQDQQEQNQQNQEDQQSQQDQPQEQQGQENKEQDKPQDQSEAPQEEEQEKQQSSGKNGQSEEQNQQEAEAPQPTPSEQMTQEEAMMLLESLREEENASREKMRLRLGRPEEVDKDW